MLNSECIEMFEKYLREEKKSSSNTLSSYLRDIRQFGAYLDLHTDTDIVSATEDELSEYINWLKGQGKSVATVSRCIASLKCLYSYLTIRQIIAENPATKLVPDKGEHKLPQILTSQEVDLLLEQPECIDAKGYRDKAMLELLQLKPIVDAGLRLGEGTGASLAIVVLQSALDVYNQLHK